MPTTEANTSPTGAARTKCPLCGEPLGDNPDACSKCDWVKGYRQRQEAPVSSTRDLIACLLSILVPGAGHLYKGHKVTGWMFLGGTLLALFLALLAATPTMGWGLILLPLYWMWVMIQAFWVEDLKYPAATGR
jgi:hypothetical protein